MNTDLKYLSVDKPLKNTVDFSSSNFEGGAKLRIVFLKTMYENLYKDPFHLIYICTYAMEWVYLTTYILQIKKKYYKRSFNFKHNYEWHHST